jgi:amino acid transporter
MRSPVDLPSARTEQTRGRSLFFLRAVLLVVVVPALVIVSYGAFALQGHQEDFPSKPMQTWPIGVSALALAAALAWVATRPSRGLQPLVAVIALVCFMVTWAAYLS